MKRRVYLDHLASTPLAPEVQEAIRPWLSGEFGNPSSLHQHGLSAREALDQARSQIAALIHAASPEEVIFTSGGTEANNLALKGAALARREWGRHLVLSAIEHPSVDRSATFLQEQGFCVTRVRVDWQGRIDPSAVAAAITDQTILIALHHANHDLGTIQDLASLGQLAQERQIPLFVDATASGGWLPIDVQALGIALLSLAPHRFYGPQGVGALYCHRRINLTPLIHGGRQESGRRAGTENVAANVGAGAAAELATRELDRRAKHVAALQRRLHVGIMERVEYVRLNGPAPGPHRLPHHLNYSLEFLEGEGLALALDLQGIAIASGAACVTQALAIPPALAAIGLDAALAKGNVLLSLGGENTDEDIDHVLEVFSRQVSKLRSLSPAWADFLTGKVVSKTSPHGPAEQTVTNRR